MSESIPSSGSPSSSDPSNEEPERFEPGKARTTSRATLALVLLVSLAVAAAVTLFIEGADSSSPPPGSRVDEDGDVPPKPEIALPGDRLEVRVISAPLLRRGLEKPPTRTWLIRTETELRDLLGLSRKEGEPEKPIPKEYKVDFSKQTILRIVTLHRPRWREPEFQGVSLEGSTLHYAILAHTAREEAAITPPSPFRKAYGSRPLYSEQHYDIVIERRLEGEIEVELHMEFHGSLEKTPVSPEVKVIYFFMLCAGIGAVLLVVSPFAITGFVLIVLYMNRRSTPPEDPGLEPDGEPHSPGLPDPSA